jgi:hypothetical protein
MPRKKQNNAPGYVSSEHESENLGIIYSIRGKLDSELVNIVSDHLTLNQLEARIANLVSNRSPEYMVILIEKDPKVKKYKSSIYINDKEYYKKR